MGSDPSSLSRRRFLKKTALGLTAAGAAAAAPGWVLTRNGADGKSEIISSQPGDTPAGSPLVAYVRDASKGEVVLMIGTQEIVRRDPALVARLVRCCQA